MNSYLKQEIDDQRNLTAEHQSPPNKIENLDTHRRSDSALCMCAVDDCFFVTSSLKTNTISSAAPEHNDAINEQSGLLPEPAHFVCEWSQ
jgi:hypothetical protein